jgi:hypothetical protein
LDTVQERGIEIDAVAQIAQEVGDRKTAGFRKKSARDARHHPAQIEGHIERFAACAVILVESGLSFRSWRSGFGDQPCGLNP